MIEVTDEELQEFLDALDAAVNHPDSRGYATGIIVDGKMVFLPGIQVDFPCIEQG